MKKLIVVDGNDGIGKSTQVRILQEKLGAHLFIQPNGSNLIGFLRNEVKNNQVYDPFSRQLLHTVSHVVDAFTQFKDKDIYIMDRAHSSTYAYGLAQKIHPEHIQLLMKIHAQVYAEALKDFDIRFVLLDRSEKFVSGDTDEFEKMVNWKEVRNKFLELENKLEAYREHLFSPTEKRLYLNVDGMEKDAISAKLLEFVS